jgi:hypothetical protein
MNVVEKYLDRYADPSARTLADQVRGIHAAALVIPVHDEPEPILDAPPDALHILVVNATTAQSRAQRQNRRFLESLSRSDAQRLVIDRSTPPHSLPDGEGVGFARRLGCDVALALWARGQIRSRFLHTTDADARLPKDVFTRASAAAPDVVALCYPFVHVAPDGGPPSRALALYERSLHYYVAGLRYAGSRYAFPTLGSCIAIDAETYARVRGFPRRLAGEDFYLLNKARKLGPVAVLDGAPIRIHERPSARVPFGTGPATARFEQALARGEAPRFYEPQVFSLLREVLFGIDTFARERMMPTFSSTLIDSVLYDLGAPAAFAEAAEKTRAADVLWRRLHDWFDAFRTLKFLHALRDRALPSVPWTDAVSRAPWYQST